MDAAEVRVRVQLRAEVAFIVLSIFFMTFLCQATIILGYDHLSSECYLLMSIKLHGRCVGD
jgi:hypothetical protein